MPRTQGALAEIALLVMLLPYRSPYAALRLSWVVGGRGPAAPATFRRPTRYHTLLLFCRGEKDGLAMPGIWWICWGDLWLSGNAILSSSACPRDGNYARRRSMPASKVSLGGYHLRHEGWRPLAADYLYNSSTFDRDLCCCDFIFFYLMELSLLYSSNIALWSWYVHLSSLQHTARNILQPLGSNTAW